MVTIYLFFCCCFFFMQNNYNKTRSLFMFLYMHLWRNCHGGKKYVKQKWYKYKSKSGEKRQNNKTKDGIGFKYKDIVLLSEKGCAKGQDCHVLFMFVFVVVVERETRDLNK